MCNDQVKNITANGMIEDFGIKNDNIVFGVRFRGFLVESGGESDVDGLSYG